MSSDIQCQRVSPWLWNDQAMLWLMTTGLAYLLGRPYNDPLFSAGRLLGQWLLVNSYGHGGEVVLAMKLEGAEPLIKTVLVGMATITPVHTLTASVGRIEMVVGEKYRQQGVEAALFTHCVAWAKHREIHHLELVCPALDESWDLVYTSLGFERRDTNVYRLVL